jgi:hypothetical protein
VVRVRRIALRLTYVIGGLLVSSAAQGDADCERAATVAEHAWHLPPGLLLAG